MTSFAFDLQKEHKPSRAKWIGAVALHAGLGVGVYVIEAPERPADIVTISVVEAEKKKDLPPPTPAKDPPASEEAPISPTPPRLDTPRPPPQGRGARGPSPNLGDLPPATGGGGGLEIPEPFTNAPPPSPAPLPSHSVASPDRTVAKVLGPPKPDDVCAEPLQKAKAKSVPQPAYPPAAREAGVEGKVRVEVTIDATGAVTSARVVSGLGHGLDEAALSAARSATFSPATQCGKPVGSTFVIGMRFAL